MRIAVAVAAAAVVVSREPGRGRALVVRGLVQSRVMAWLLAAVLAFALAAGSATPVRAAEANGPSTGEAGAGETAPAAPSLAAALTLLAGGEAQARLPAIEMLTAVGGDAAIRILEAMRDGRLVVTPAGQALAEGDGRWLDLVSGAAVAAGDGQPVAVNNRLRNAITAALAGLGLTSADPAMRLAAARGLQEKPDPARLEALRQARAVETDEALGHELAMALGLLELSDPDPVVRTRAAGLLATADRREVLSLLEAIATPRADGSHVEPDPGVRAAAAASLAEVDRRLTRNEYLGRAFAGLSLGSILMLAALGLAITYGLLGVINMAHGEMIMIGAYCAWLTQGLVRQYLPGWFDVYPILALPVAFAVCGLVGIVIERLVIRHLYGRPLETLLATWGVSLILIQLVRQLFGPQNVEIVNPSWMSGGIEWSSLVLPWNRVVIIGFAVLVLVGTALILARTRLGLFVRGVTQNRPMAGAIGVPTARVDMLAFGLGSAIAGLAGVALSQVGNVGPELGQAWIIDSFIVVVAGGVGQLAGAVVAGLGLGMLAKFIEPSMGAVITKIIILVVIIGFIQRRPQGLFALRERGA